MNYYFLGKGYGEEPMLVKIPKADNREDANKIIEKDTARRGYNSTFWDKWGVILSMTEMKSIKRKIGDFINDAGDKK